MAHINDLSPKVLYQILCLASGPPAKDIDKWKPKLTLLQVCTMWYDLFKSYVFSQGFVDIYQSIDSGDIYANMRSCVYYADNEIVCRSNLGIITGRDEYNCDCVAKLEMGVDNILDISTYGHFLIKLLTLGVGYWLNLTSLAFYIPTISSSSSKSIQPNLEELAITASHYIHEFQNRLPNITHLHVVIQEDKTITTAFYILIDHYAQHLKHLYFVHPTGQHTLPLFSTELTYLLLNLDNCANQDPSFCAKSLQFLYLYGMSSSSFTWWLFHDFATPGYIEFSNLKTLYLSYDEQTDKEMKLSEKYSKQTRPYGTHILRFPKLESLGVHSPPVDCDVFYTDSIPTDLKSLAIFGFCDSVIAVSRLRFTRINEVYIEVRGGETFSNNLYIAADRYFGYTKIGSTCEAVFETPIDIQRTVSWVNVTRLQLHTIEFVELLKHIPNFYNLRNLKFEHINVDEKSKSIIELGLEEEEEGTFELLDTKLKHIRFDNIEPKNPYNSLAILNHLLLRITTLEHVDIGIGQREIVYESFLPEKYPHVKFSAVPHRFPF